MKKKYSVVIAEIISDAFTYEVSVFVEGRSLGPEYCSFSDTRWGARRAAKRFIRRHENRVGRTLYKEIYEVG